MYIVVNTTGSTLNISDLDLSIPPNQSRDLDKMSLSRKPEESNDLRTAIGKHYLKVVKKDHKKSKKNKEVRIESTERVVEKKTVVEKQSIDEVKIAKIIREQLLKSKEEDKKTIAEETIQQMLVMMGELLKKDSPNYNIVKKDDERSIEDSIGIEELSNIHARAMKKISQETENKIDYEQETTKDNSLSERANELEGLL